MTMAAAVLVDFITSRIKFNDTQTQHDISREIGPSLAGLLWGRVIMMLLSWAQAIKNQSQ